MDSLFAYTADSEAYASSRAFLHLMVGPPGSGLTEFEAAYLVKNGYLTPKEALHGYLVPGVGIDLFQMSVMMGSLMGRETALPGVVVKSWDEGTKLRSSSLQRWVKRVEFRIRMRRAGYGRLTSARFDSPAHLSPEESAAWLSARTRSATYIKAIGEDVRAMVRTEVQGAIADQVGWPELQKRLEAKFPSHEKDWKRVARTELQGAFNEGVAASATELYGRDAKMAFLTESDACDKCVDLYRNPDGTPRVYDLKTLIDNGANVGRPKHMWAATIWPVHPNCRCSPVVVPPGKDVDGNWQLTEKAYSALNALDALSNEVARA